MIVNDFFFILFSFHWILCVSMFDAHTFCVGQRNRFEINFISDEKLNYVVSDCSYWNSMRRKIKRRSLLWGYFGTAIGRCRTTESSQHNCDEQSKCVSRRNCSKASWGGRAKTRKYRMRVISVNILSCKKMTINSLISFCENRKN